MSFIRKLCDRYKYCTTVLLATLQLCILLHFFHCTLYTHMSSILFMTLLVCNGVSMCMPGYGGALVGVTGGSALQTPPPDERLSVKEVWACLGSLFGPVPASDGCQPSCPAAQPDTLASWSSVMRFHCSSLSLRCAPRTPAWAVITSFWSPLTSSSTRRWKPTIRGTGWRSSWTWKRRSGTKLPSERWRLSAGWAAPTRPLSETNWQA